MRQGTDEVRPFYFSWVEEKSGGTDGVSSGRIRGWLDGGGGVRHRAVCIREADGAVGVG